MACFCKDGSAFSLLFSLGPVGAEAFGVVPVDPLGAEIEEIAEKELVVVVVGVAFVEDLDVIGFVEEVDLGTVDVPFECPETESKGLVFGVTDFPVAVTVVVAGDFVFSPNDTEDLVSPPMVVLVFVVEPCLASTGDFCDGTPLLPAQEDEGGVGIRREDITVVGCLRCADKLVLGRTPSPNSRKGGITRFPGSGWWLPFMCGCGRSE